jgi:hypothetical protein
LAVPARSVVPLVGGRDPGFVRRQAYACRFGRRMAAEGCSMADSARDVRNDDDNERGEPARPEGGAAPRLPRVVPLMSPEQLRAISGGVRLPKPTPVGLPKPAPVLSPEQIQAISAHIAETLPPFTELRERLPRALAPILENPPGWEERIGAWTQRVREAVLAAQPPNWRRLKLADVETAFSLMVEHGLNIAWVPRGEVVRELLSATDVAARDAVLIARETELIEDVERALDAIELGELAGPVDALREAVAAFRDGHHRAAQALATVTLGTVIHDTFGEEHFAQCPPPLRSVGAPASRLPRSAKRSRSPLHRPRVAADARRRAGLQPPCCRASPVGRPVHAAQHDRIADACRRAAV